MPIDPNIALGIRPVEIADPLTQAGKVLGIRGAMQSQQLGAVQLENAQREQRHAQIYDQAAKESGGDLGAMSRRLMELGNADAAIKTSLANTKALKDAADLQKTQGEVVAQRMQQYRDSMADVKTPEDARQHSIAMHADPVLGPVLARQGNTLDQSLARIPTDPDQFQQYVQQKSLGMAKFLEANAPKTFNQDTGGSVTTYSRPGLGGAPTPLVTTPKTESPEGKANRATRLLVAGLDEQGNPRQMSQPGQQIDLAQVSPADLQAGYRYFSDGTLPPNMGRGIQGQQQSTRIRSIAAQISQNLGVPPEEARANQLAFKGAGAALTPLLKREAQVGANVRNFDFNSGQVLSLSQKVDRTGVPVVNAWLNAGRRSISGNPDVSAFDVAVKTTVNEFAQIVSGTTAGATTEGEKQKAEALLNAAQTPAQITAVINQMKIESQNRMKSFADQKRATLSTMRAGGGAQPAAETTAATNAPAKAAPQSFDSLPDPSKFEGKTMTDTSTGTKYVSRGGKWVRQ